MCAAGGTGRSISSFSTSGDGMGVTGRAAGAEPVTGAAGEVEPGGTANEREGIDAEAAPTNVRKIVVRSLARCMRHRWPQAPSRASKKRAILRRRLGK